MDLQTLFTTTPERLEALSRLPGYDHSGSPGEKQLLYGTGRQLMRHAQRVIREVSWRHSIYSKQRACSQVNARFHQLAPAGMAAVSEHFKSIRQVHQLAWSLDAPSSGRSRNDHAVPFLDLALAIIEQRFHYGMLLGLFDLLLKRWVGLDRDSRQVLSDFIAKKASDYSARRICLDNIRRYAKYYTRRDGPAALSRDLWQSGFGLALVWEYLQLPDHVATYEYFSEVAIAYTRLIVQEGECEQGFPDIIQFLGMHQQIEVSKKCLTMMIPALDGCDAPTLDESVQAAALDLVGNPVDPSQWDIWSGATSAEADDFDRARRKVGKLIIAWLIQYFFEHINPDPAKASWWLKQIRHISAVTIFCSDQFYEKAKCNPRLSSYLRTHFIVLSGAQNKDSVLVLTVKNYFLIEAVVGESLFWACRLDNPAVSGGTPGQVKSIDLRRLLQMEPLLQRRGENVIKHRREGKLSRGELRESLLAWWMRHHLGV
ncbi:EH signature domain-containing protein [Desulfoferrobacter suflitae]|uniref:EH signature domain-containing protein n=1 Tax=Desulfoferrobacter suflitae TaxID=2865782 RepID=UPI00216446B3|nr:EH signature domain-containing protein [Desulfoferrobacter suflitae]MCK8602371.1 EH signature domain-containing protein [Desulfoferrobacter suflitae]